MNTINDIPLDRLLGALDVTMEDLRSPVRTRPLSDARAMVAAIFRKHYRISQVEVAGLLGTSQVAVCKMLKRHQQLLQDPTYRNKFNQVKISMSNL
jgi:chromosomal replication initiation ATPase DnaA